MNQIGNSAVLALKKAAKCVSEEDCVSIAPEGTRSKTGQLLDFKKGKIYLFFLYTSILYINCKNKIK